MASTPAFVATPRIGVQSVSTANTNRDGTGTISSAILTGAAGGTKVTSIAVVSTANPADSIINLFLHDGTNFWYFDAFDIGDPTAASATVEGFRWVKSYADLVLPSGWSVRASITAAPTAGVVNVFAFGGDF